MKTKFFLFLLLCMFSSELYSQKNRNYTIPTPSSKSFVWKTGKGTFVDVKFLYSLKEPLNSEVLKTFVMQMMVKSEFQLKNKLSFKPLELMIFEDDEKKLNGFTKYSGVNDFGVEKELKSYFELDKTSSSVTLMFTN